MPPKRSANLCWGQRYHWLRYISAPPGSRYEAHITDNLPLPAGVTLGHIQAVLNYLVRRHEVLRTVYRFAPRSSPWQEVQPPTQMPITVATNADDGTPAPAEMIRTLIETDFDMTDEWPIRAGVVTTAAGVPQRLHMVFNHVAFDDVSLGRLRVEFTTVLSAALTGRAASMEPVAHQPVDLARREAARPAAAADALRYWRQEVGRLPADGFARRRAARRETGPAHSASLTSHNLLQTTRDIADMNRVWPSAVHLAAYAITMSSYNGEAVSAHRMYTSQREASGHLDVMTCMSYPTIVSVELGDDPPFSEVLSRAAARIEQSLTHAHVPFDEVVELLARESTRRGQPVRIASELNYLSQAPRSCGARRERFTRNPAPTEWAKAGSDTYFRIYEWADGVTLVLQAVAAVMDRDSVERWLRGYARLLAAHRDPAVDMRVSQAAELMGFAPVSPRRFVWVGGDTVDIEQTEAALCKHEAVDSARVSVTDRGLAADIVVKCPLGPAELRRQVLDGMYAHPAARCPDWFRVIDAEGLVETVAGDGLESSRVQASTDAQRALAGVVTHVNGLDDVNLADSYSMAGGRVLRIPQVVAALAGAGWRGVSIDHLAGSRPLSALANLMVRS